MVVELLCAQLYGLTLDILRVLYDVKMQKGQLGLIIVIIAH